VRSIRTSRGAEKVSQTFLPFTLATVTVTFPLMMTDSVGYLEKQSPMQHSFAVGGSLRNLLLPCQPPHHCPAEGGAALSVSEWPSVAHGALRRRVSSNLAQHLQSNPVGDPAIPPEKSQRATKPSL